MKCDTKLTNARCKVLIDDPWYGIIVSRMRWIENESVGTMGVRIMRLGVVECLYAPSFIDELDIKQIIGVIKHEIEHILRMHLTRDVKFRDNKHAHEIWNVAADWVINGPKAESGSRHEPRIKDLPPNGCFIPTPTNPGIWKNCNLNSLDINSTTEEFAAWIQKNTEYKDIKMLGANGGLIAGKALCPLGSNSIISADLFDNHDSWSSGEASVEEMRNTAKDLARAATQAAGQTPGHLTEAIAALDKAEINWSYILRNAIGRAAGGRRLTYARRHRKRDQFGIKGSSNRNRVKLTIMVDISGSVSTKMLQKFFAEIEQVSQHFKIKLVTFDHIVQSTSDYHRGDWKNIKLKGRGGTSFKNCLDYVEQNGLVGRMNIMLTDGFDQIPEPRQYPFVWVIIGRSGKEYVESQNMWGEMIYIEYDSAKDDIF